MGFVRTFFFFLFFSFFFLHFHFSQETGNWRTVFGYLLRC